MKLFSLCLLISAIVRAQGPVSGSGGGSGGGGGSVTAGTGILVVGSQVSIDPAVTQTQATDQAGTVKSCVSHSGSNSAATCTMNPVLVSYTSASQIINWIPDFTPGGGALTLNAGPSAVSVTESDGASNPIASDWVSGKLVPLWYDGTVLRMVNTPPAATSLFSTAGTGQWWLFGYPMSFNNAVIPNMSGGCTTTCNIMFWEVTINATFTFRNFIIHQGTAADSGKFIALALYNDAGPVATCTAGQSTTTASTGLICPITASGSYTVTPGIYYLAFTSNSTTASFGSVSASSAAGTLLSFDPANGSSHQHIFYVTGVSSLSTSTFTWPGSIGTRVQSTQDPPHVALVP